MITRGEKQAIKMFLQDPKWQIVEHIAQERVEKIRGDSIVKDTEWETLRTALLNEGNVRGVKEFIQELYRLAQEANE